jgi:hypothetical protein
MKTGLHAGGVAGLGTDGETGNSATCQGVADHQTVSICFRWAIAAQGLR